MNASDFNYSLPPERIAIHPPKVRGSSRLLVLNRKTGRREHAGYADLADFLQPGDVLVINETKVIKARVLARNKHGKERELLLLEKHAHDEDWHRHKAIYRGKLHENEQLTIGAYNIRVKRLYPGGTALLESQKDLQTIAQQYGSVPLPPYMKRTATEEDTHRYQTVFAAEAGSVAAPTASLNMTSSLLKRFKQKGVVIAPMTLHVGMGTFLPIRTDNLKEHTMHREYFEIPSHAVANIASAKQRGSRIIAVGTTVTRALEYAHKQIQEEDEQDITGEADIFIYPGYEFKVIDSLLTNFHAPRSTVLMMAAAFAGWDNLKEAYQEAIDEEYTMLSYGDSMLIH